MFGIFKRLKALESRVAELQVKIWEPEQKVHADLQRQVMRNIAFKGACPPIFEELQKPHRQQKVKAVQGKTNGNGARVLELLASGNIYSASQVAKRLGITRPCASSSLVYLAKTGAIIRVKRGKYRRAV